MSSVPFLERLGSQLRQEFRDHLTALTASELAQLTQKPPSSMVTVEGRIFNYYEIDPRSALLYGGQLIKKYGGVIVVSSKVSTKPETDRIPRSQSDLISDLAAGERHRAATRGEYIGSHPKNYIVDRDPHPEYRPSDQLSIV